MITVRISADIHEDRRVVLTLPPEVPIGPSELIVSVAAKQETESTRSSFSLADWAEQNAEHWGNRLSAQDVESFTGRGG
jgi:hypothetical protein